MGIIELSKRLATEALVSEIPEEKTEAAGAGASRRVCPERARVQARVEGAGAIVAPAFVVGGDPPTLRVMAGTVGTVCSPYQAALDEAFDALDPEVRRAHLAPLAAAGTFDVEHGSHWLAPALVRLLKLPAAGGAQPVHLDVTVDGDGLVWTRRIGAVLVRTRQTAAGSRIVERSGLGRILFALTAADGALVYRQTSFSIAGIPLPGFAAPHLSARVSPVRRGWHVDVSVTWRRHLVCRYSGLMAIA